MRLSVAILSVLGLICVWPASAHQPQQFPGTNQNQPHHQQVGFKKIKSRIREIIGEENIPLNKPYTAILHAAMLRFNLFFQATHDMM